MKLSRRDALKRLAAAPIVRLTPEATLRAAWQSGFRLQAEDRALIALADVILPAESDRKAALAAFIGWIDHYKENADTDHGYGVTRVRATGPSPAGNYPAQLAALDDAARAAGAASFVTASPAQRRAIVEAALVAAKIERLPVRPTGIHIAADLMGHYFGSAAANDLCYRAAINRDACRGLAGSEQPPQTIPPKSGSDRGKR
jgi:hypothetical protein